MPRTTTQIKTRKAAKSVNTNTEQEEQVEAFPKTKKALEVDEPETILGLEEKEEKLDEDGMPIVDDEESGSDDSGIDDEELNPFGDKWEE